MSIRSYKQIYEAFSTLFPELNKAVDSWKGIRFADKHIMMLMKNGTAIHFIYFGTDQWELHCVPDDSYKVVDE